MYEYVVIVMRWYDDYDLMYDVWWLWCDYDYEGPLFNLTLNHLLIIAWLNILLNFLYIHYERSGNFLRWISLQLINYIQTLYLQIT